VEEDEEGDDAVDIEVGMRDAPPGQEEEAGEFPEMAGVAEVGVGGPDQDLQSDENQDRARGEKKGTCDMVSMNR